MEISSTTSASAANSAQSTTQTSFETNSLGEDAFMKLLLAQLQNQDPLQPMQDQEFVAQLAQFNSLSQLTQLNKNLETFMSSQLVGQGSSLIGKTVTGYGSDGSEVSGIVSGLRVSGGKVTLSVAGADLPLDKVSTVKETERSSDDDGQNSTSFASTS
ncbi:MAG TPA: flagellar hook capping FlgD N-terminal domain-containing protein [Anaerolineae bacterium]|nr:flagellar hook capping FlgD N-terminal domain-containing protein [Anaerolineae bacterium]HMR64313.1 flagellar hook capping FlgD N-terminal domain-containing protein [Anaerolineae bacterium]